MLEGVAAHWREKSNYANHCLPLTHIEEDNDLQLGLPLCVLEEIYYNVNIFISD